MRTKEPFPSKKRIADLQRAMGLADWDISYALVPGKDLTDRYAESHYFALDREAFIKVGRREDYNSEPFAVPSYENSILHELGHVLLCQLPLDHTSDEEESVVNAIIKALYRFKALA